MHVLIEESVREVFSSSVMMRWQTPRCGLGTHNNEDKMRGFAGMHAQDSNELACRNAGVDDQENVR